jgi:hypothetical protein
MKMLCQNCNYKIRSGTSFCTWCGLSLAYAAHPRAAAAITIAKTIRLLSARNSTKRPLLVSIFAILYIIAAIPCLLNGFFSIANTLYAVNNTITVGTTTSLGFALLFIALGFLFYLTGVGLWNLKPKFRIIHMIISTLSIFTMIGAPIGVLMLWYFSRPEIRKLFRGKTKLEFILNPF